MMQNALCTRTNICELTVGVVVVMVVVVVVNMTKKRKAAAG
jgi:hypothetical protein